MSTALGVMLLVLASTTLLGSILSVTRIGTQPTVLAGGRAAFVVAYLIFEAAILLLAARELFQ